MEKNICEICSKIFTRARNLRRHFAAVHQNAKVQCEKFFKKFNRKDAMDKQKFCVCRLCGVSFSTSLELARYHCTERKEKRSGGPASMPQKKKELIPGKWVKVS